MDIVINFRFLLVLILGLSAFAQADTLYKCKDESGVVLYTNQKGTAKKCSVLSSDQPITTIPAARQATRNTTPGDFPRVDGDTQRGRDGDRRRILEQELAAEQLNLDKARKSLAEGEATRLGDEKSYQKYLDRVQGLKDNIALHERNIEALKRELANLK
ncbi:MAG: DUF4124 domain-containing protein [Proteobacteria bacterium]|nr:DUF4124 domain-containing protein [Pseudomonadota bacterium]